MTGNSTLNIIIKLYINKSINVVLPTKSDTRVVPLDCNEEIEDKLSENS